MTKDKNIASKYGKDIKEVEVKYKNPLIINNEQDYQKHAEFFGDKYGEAKSLYNSKQRAVAIMKQGYDAVIDNIYGQIYRNFLCNPVSAWIFYMISRHLPLL